MTATPANAFDRLTTYNVQGDTVVDLRAAATQRAADLGWSEWGVVYNVGFRLAVLGLEDIFMIGKGDTRAGRIGWSNMFRGQLSETGVVHSALVLPQDVAVAVEPTVARAFSAGSVIPKAPGGGWSTLTCGEVRLDMGLTAHHVMVDGGRCAGDSAMIGETGANDSRHARKKAAEGTHRTAKRTEMHNRGAGWSALSAPEVDYIISIIDARLALTEAMKENA